MLTLSSGLLIYGLIDIKLCQFAVVTWALWINRNKMTVETKFPLSPIDVLYIEIFLQKCRTLLREGDLWNRTLSDQKIFGIAFHVSTLQSSFLQRNS
jgi:hypothetical protein